MPTAEVLKAFILTYFDPETAGNPALRQALSYFLPVFCHSKLKNARLMAEIAVTVISKLLIMRDENVDEEEADDMVGWPVITGHLAEWTDGRKVVGATELGLDGKTSTTAEAEEPHIYLAIEVLERALTNTCSKEERKPLLALLGKLHIAPSSTRSKSEEASVDDESLPTLHSLVSEAVEGKIGTDATQRNALVKLETILTKRLGEVAQMETERDATPEQTTVVGAAAGTNEATVLDETEITELPVRTKPVMKVEEARVEPEDEEEEEEEEEEDTMLAGMQGEGTRMPLEDDDDDDDDEEDEEESSVRRTMVTEDDIMEDLLQSEMSV
jgi:condensin complex subunit 3